MAAERSFRTLSVEATEALAAAVGALAGVDLVVCLDGDLGAGKTAFVRGLARGLEVTEPVSSPTYTLMHTYPGRLELYHFDAWMEGREAAFLEGGGAEWLHAGGVAVVEWAARVATWLPDERLEVLLEHEGAPAATEACDGYDPYADRPRRLRFRAIGPGPVALLGALEVPTGASELPENPDRTP